MENTTTFQATSEYQAFAAHRQHEGAFCSECWDLLDRYHDRCDEIRKELQK